MMIRSSPKSLFHVTGLLAGMVVLLPVSAVFADQGSGPPARPRPAEVVREEDESPPPETINEQPPSKPPTTTEAPKPPEVVDETPAIEVPKPPPVVTTTTPAPAPVTTPATDPPVVVEVPVLPPATPTPPEPPVISPPVVVAPEPPVVPVATPPPPVPKPAPPPKPASTHMPAPGGKDYCPGIKQDYIAPQAAPFAVRYVEIAVDPALYPEIVGKGLYQLIRTAEAHFSASPVELSDHVLHQLAADTIAHTGMTFNYCVRIGTTIVVAIPA